MMKLRNSDYVKKQPNKLKAAKIMWRSKIFPIIISVLILTFFLLTVSVSSAVDGLPNYKLQYLGPGSPTAINNTGIVVGAKTINNNYQPLVSKNGGSWDPLPVPAGSQSTFPTDVNDSGVVVGVSFSTQMVPSAVRWLSSGDSYTLDILPRLPGSPSSYATGINDLGQIVGAKSALGYVPTGTGWLYSDGGGLVDLQLTYGTWSAPVEINDLGEALFGSSLLDVNTGTSKVLAPQPSNYQGVYGVDVNNSGMVAGEGALRSTSLNIRSVFRYVDDGTGWTYLSGTSKYTVAASINDLGDVGYGELGAGIYLDGLGTYAVWALLDPDVVNAGWTVTGSYPEINNDRMIALTGKNYQTGESGGVLLTPDGFLQPPNAPVDLQGVAHPADWSHPWNSIDLSWTNTSPLTKGYVLERSVSGANTWFSLSLIPPGTATNFSDNTVEAGMVYDYRIAAVGLAGNSEWSGIITVVAPITPVDKTAPIVVIQSPVSGDTVAGSVTVSAVATDNVGVDYFEISYWNQYLGQQIILGSIYGGGPLSVGWNTNALTPDTYMLRAYAYDALGNWSESVIPVNVVSLAQSMTVTNISLSGKLRFGRVNVTGDVFVKDNLGRAVPGATVEANWRLPSGAIRSTTGVTNVNGRARLISTGGRGTYTLTVQNVTKTGLVFDSANSVLTKSITK